MKEGGMEGRNKGFTFYLFVLLLIELLNVYTAGDRNANGGQVTVCSAHQLMWKDYKPEVS